MDWTPGQVTEAGSLLSTVFWSQKEREPSSPIQGYHQKKPEDERHKDRLLDITLTAERQMESNSQVMEAVFDFVASHDDIKLNTRQGMGSSAAGCVQHSQDISWQARQKTPGLVRPQRPGATDSYEQKRSSPPESVANQEH